MAIEIKYNYAKEGMVRIIGVKAMAIGKIPKKFINDHSNDILFKNDDKLIYAPPRPRETNQHAEIILEVNATYSKKQFDKRIKIIRRCGEALHQYNKKTLNRIRTIRI